jgi:hypothetical protein
MAQRRALAGRRAGQRHDASIKGFSNLLLLQRDDRQITLLE